MHSFITTYITVLEKRNFLHPVQVRLQLVNLFSELDGSFLMPDIPLAETMIFQEEDGISFNGKYYNCSICLWLLYPIFTIIYHRRHKNTRIVYAAFTNCIYDRCVSNTASCNNVHTWSAVLIGMIFY